jgi:prolyl-tRNA editing enzyme YbaK/EbsC (Cys-tRNA(Pro) deacylase)
MPIYGRFMRHPLEQQVVDDLEALAADFEALEIDPAFADTAAFCERYGFTLGESANAILIASKRPEGLHCLCLALATTRLDVNHRVRGLMGVRKLSFASADATDAVTGMEIGGVTPFGLAEPPPIYVDEKVMTLDRVIVGGGTRAMKVSVDPEVFGRMKGVTVVGQLAG